MVVMVVCDVCVCVCGDGGVACGVCVCGGGRGTFFSLSRRLRRRVLIGDCDRSCVLTCLGSRFEVQKKRDRQEKEIAQLEANIEQVRVSTPCVDLAFVLLLRWASHSYHRRGL